MKCERTGLVRREHVIRAGVSVTSYYCGACNHTWTVPDEDDTRKTPRRQRSRAADKSDRSR